MGRDYILVINPGSTSTKVALYKGEKRVKLSKIEHKVDELQRFKTVFEQYHYRLDLIYKWLEKENVSSSSLKVVVGRGGLLRSIPGGTYLVTDKMVKDLKIGVQGEHASNLGGILARGIADKENIKAYIVDPVAVDEFEDISRISGLKQIQRRSLIHSLNVKAVSRRRAKELNKGLNDLNFIVAHLGGGISIVPIQKGYMVDANNASEMGPFSPERTGELPVGDLVKLCFNGKYSYEDMKKKLKGQGGLASYLNTTDAREIESKIKIGNKKAKLVFNSMAYQISKEIGAMSTVLKGNVDNIILTGGLAHSEFLISRIKEMVEFIAEVIVYPGEDEMEALNQGVLRILSNDEKEKIYEDEVLFNVKKF